MKFSPFGLINVKWLKKNIIGVSRTVIFRTKSIYRKKNPFNRVERVNKIIKIKNII